jgi:hypothetical protein
MPRNQWLAIDAATPPATRAREVRRAWERFQGDGRAPIRDPIADSWRRSQTAGVDPFPGWLAPVVSDSDETSARWESHPLARAAHIVRACVGEIAEEAAHLLVVSDADGVLLWIEGNARVRMEAADGMNFTEGTLWSEGGIGTNAIGTAVAADHAVQVFAAEHYNEVVQAWTCAAAPVHDPDTGRLLGIIDLTGRMTTVHPHSLAVASAASTAVEAQLRCEMNERHARLGARYSDQLGATAGRRALVTPTGRVVVSNPEGWLAPGRLVLPPGGGEVLLADGARAFAEPVGHEEAFIVREADQGGGARRRAVLRLGLLGRDRARVEVDGEPVDLSPRHTEVLALLSARPGGMTSEELAADLYAGEKSPATVRVEIHRLRKLFGAWIDNDPYRLSADVESDVARVRGLLHRGAVRAATERYEGPLLPHSEAPGIVREREDLDAWVRQAVMTSDDDEALWAWVECPSGREDLPALKRLLSRLDFRDPRRSHTAARITALRNSYTS